MEQARNCVWIITWFKDIESGTDIQAYFTFLYTKCKTHLKKNSKI